VPSPLPSSTLTSPCLQPLLVVSFTQALVTTKSGMPSPFTSPTATE